MSVAIHRYEKPKYRSETAEIMPEVASVEHLLEQLPEHLLEHLLVHLLGRRLEHLRYENVQESCTS